MSDVVVIGGGVNGMAAALHLARAGRKVTLVEAASRLGGAMGTVEFLPGFHSPTVALTMPALDARLKLGLNFTPLDTTALAADGHHLVTKGAFFETVEGLADPDLTAWKNLRARLLRHATALQPFKSLPPPKLTALRGNNAGSLLKALLGLRLLGKDEFRELLRLILINVADVVEDELTDPRLQALIAHDAVLGTHSGPRSPNSLLPLYYRLSCGGTHWPVGGFDAVISAFETALTAAGVTIRLGERVVKIETKGDVITGVATSAGEIKAPHVLAALDAKSALLNLVGPRILDAGMVRQTRAIRQRGHVARLNLALSGLPDLRGADPKARLVIAPSVQAVERAWNAVKYGENAAEPVMELIFPSAHDVAFAPKGQHVLSANVSFASGGGWLPQVMAVLERHLPGISDKVVKADLKMPGDLETQHRIAEWHHGELSVEQMMVNRPFHGVQRYATPLKGLYLGGASSHPGGYLQGTAGLNAAEAMIRGAR
jgi:phytoene dehydrogenase-like protein